jgi:hypothetical protein
MTVQTDDCHIRYLTDRLHNVVYILRICKCVSYRKVIFIPRFSEINNIMLRVRTV